MTLFKYKVKQIKFYEKKMSAQFIIFVYQVAYYLLLSYLLNSRYINLLQSSKDEAFGSIYSFTSGFSHRYH